MVDVDLRDRESRAEPYIPSIVAANLERTAVSKYHTKGGHGFAAEDANHRADQIRGKHPELVGAGNRKNGADRIVGGVLIQSKYCQTPLASLSAAFDPKTNLYRYTGQVLEVPKDQYEECVELMRSKITAGRVPGVVDPNQAEQLVRQGSVTYKQARNIARAGNIDSIVYDAKTQAVTSSSIFAISFAVQFARLRWSGDTTEDAFKDALHSACSAGITTMTTGVLTAQVLRTRAPAMGAAVARKGIRVVSKNRMGKTAIEKLAQASTGKALYGAAATNHVSRLLRTNAITATISTVVASTPDLYRAVVAQDASFGQFAKNLTMNAGGTAAGSAGWMAGAALGAALGSVIPGPGTAIGGFLGGVAGSLGVGSLGTAATKRVLDAVIEDDALRMSQLLNSAVEQLAIDYLLSEQEVEALSAIVQTTVDGKWLRGMYQAGSSNRSDPDRHAYAYNAFEPVCTEIVQKRPKVTVPWIETSLQPRDVRTESGKPHAAEGWSLARSSWNMTLYSTSRSCQYRVHAVSSSATGAEHGAS